MRVSNSSPGGHIYDWLSTGSGNTGGAGRLDLFDFTAGAPRLSITSTGNVGVGTTSPSATFAVQGGGYFSGNVSAGNVAATDTVTANLIGLQSSGLSSYDAQITATGGGPLVDRGTLNITSSGALFNSYDGSPQFGIDNTTEAAEYWMASGGIAGTGATLVARNASLSGNVSGNYAAIAGGLLATNYPFHPFVGVEYVIVMYAGVVLGGMGSIIGAFWGGMTVVPTNWLTVFPGTSTSSPQISSPTNMKLNVPVGSTGVLTAGGTPIVEWDQAGTGTSSPAYIELQNYTGDTLAHINCRGQTNTSCYFNANGTGVIYLSDAAGTMALFGPSGQNTITDYPRFRAASASSSIQIVGSSGTSILVGGTLGSGAISTSATDGFLQLPYMTGAPSGTPAHLTSGGIPIAVDTANDSLQAYINSAWQSLSGITTSSANNWTGLQQFNSASTTLFSSYGPAYFGATATSSFSSTGALSLVSNGLTVGSSQLVVSGGDVGINNGSPASALDVGGFINTGSSYGYKQAGNLILYASSTNFATLGGAGAGADIIANATSSSVTSAPFSTAFGYQALGNAGSSLLGNSSGNSAFGYQALLGTTGVFGAYQNSAFGYQALSSVTSGNNNTAFGYESLASTTGGYWNSANGNSSLFKNTTGYENTAFGNQALYNNSSGYLNTAIGNAALYNLSTGNSNVALGAGAGTYIISNSASSTMIGANAGYGNGAGYTTSGSTVVGANAGYDFTYGASFDSFLGYNSGYDNSSGYDNTFLGAYSGQNVTTGANNLAIGWNALLPSATASNQLSIGNFIFGTNLTATTSGTALPTPTGNLGIGTTTPYSRLEVWGPDTSGNTSSFVVANSASTTEFNVLDNGNATLAGTLTQNSDERLKTNIQSLNASSSLSLIDQLNPVTFNWIDPNKGTIPQLGFIAQQVFPIFPNLVSTTSPTALTPDGSPIVSAIQALSADITSIENTIAGFAQSITSQQGNFTDELCVGSTCVTPAQFQAMVAAANASQGGDSPSSPSDDGSPSSTPDTPPVIQINGDNPATVQVGATYNDLGATITGPQADLNLGITTFLNGTLTSNIVIDTSQAATDTIDYVATDQNGLIATSTRNIIIEATGSSTSGQ